MTVLGWLILILIIAIVAIIVIAGRKEHKKELYYKNISIKALRSTELQDIISDPSLSESLRNAAKDEIDRRIKSGII